jgi:hypothetical protein
VQIVINAKRNVVQIALQKYFVVQDVLHEIRGIDMNMGAGTPAKKPNFFWLGKVRLFPHLAIPVGNLQRHF